MNYLTTSQDLLYVVTSSCLMVLTILLSIILCYFIMSLHQFYSALNETKKRLKKFTDVIKVLTNLADHGMTYFSAINDYIKKKKK